MKSFHAKKKQSGFTLIEALLAISLLALVSVGVFSGTLYGEQSQVNAAATNRALLVAQKSLDIVRTIRGQQDFSVLSGLADGTTTYTLSGGSGANPWSLVPGTLISAEASLGGGITIAPTDDDNTIKITATVWPNGTTGSPLSLSTYLTNWETRFLALHSFNNDDGANPYGSLILSGSTLYGMTSDAGYDGAGTIFSSDLSGNVTTLHSFTGGSDGGYPQGDLILSGSKLYGMTGSGGDDGAGSIFSCDISNCDGTITTLYSFTGGFDGADPSGSLILSGSTLYGMTGSGGALNAGTIFSYDLNGNFATLHSFNPYSFSDGADPYGSLILSGSTLYGMTTAGGSHSAGTIFSYDLNGTFTNLHSFTNGSDGGSPYGSLILSGSKLYGMTLGGGDDDDGSIFSCDVSNCDGTITPLYSFTGGSDGGYPYGSLILSGSKLYGMTLAGGDNGAGTIFSSDLSGNVTTLYAFTNGSDGGSPYGSLILSDGILYGMTNDAGDSNVGTIFSYRLPQ